MYRSAILAPISKLVNALSDRDGAGRSELQMEEERKAAEERSKKKLLNELEEARAEWENALINSAQAVQPEVIDYFIYTMKAAQVKYRYILKAARAAGIVRETRIMARRRLPDNMDVPDDVSGLD